MDLVLDGHDGLVDGERAVGEVEVAPAEAEDFAGAHAGGGGGEDVGGGEAVCGDAVEKDPQLLGCPDAELSLIGLPHSRRVGGVGGFFGIRLLRTASCSALWTMMCTLRTVFGFSPGLESLP